MEAYSIGSTHSVLPAPSSSTSPGTSSPDRLQFERPEERPPMTYIIAEPCIGTKDTACVDVCPVDCIHPRKDEAGFAAAEMLYIHPDECIDCGACVPACPVEAIFSLDETPTKWDAFIGKKSDYYQR